MSEENKAIEKTETFALVELMGHSKVVGRVDVSPYADMRVDVLNAKGEFDRTEHVGKAAIYRVTEVTREVALALAVQHAPEPSFAWGLNVKQLNPAHDDDFMDDDEDEAHF